MGSRKTRRRGKGAYWKMELEKKDSTKLSVTFGSDDSKSYEYIILLISLDRSHNVLFIETESV